MQKVIELDPYALISVEDAYDVLGQPDPAHRYTVVDCINRATHSLEDLANRKILSRSFTWRLNGNGQRSMYLPEYPVTSVTSIKWIDDQNEVGVVLDLSHFFIDEAGLVRMSVDWFPFGSLNVEVVAVAGFRDDLPAHAGALARFRSWCKDLVIVEFQRSQIRSGDADSLTVGSSSASFRESPTTERVRKAILRAGLYKIEGV